MTWTHLFLWLPCRIFWKPKFKQTNSKKKTTQFNFFAYAKIAAWAKRNEGKMGKAEKNLLKLFRNICNLSKTWPGKLNCFAVDVSAASVFLLLLFIHPLCCWHVVNTVIALSRCNCIFAIVVIFWSSSFDCFICCSSQFDCFDLMRNYLQLSMRRMRNMQTIKLREWTGLYAVLYTRILHISGIAADYLQFTTCCPVCRLPTAPKQTYFP